MKKILIPADKALEVVELNEELKHKVIMFRYRLQPSQLFGFVVQTEKDGWIMSYSSCLGSFSKKCRDKNWTTLTELIKDSHSQYDFFVFE